MPKLNYLSLPQKVELIDLMKKEPMEFQDRQSAAATATSILGFKVTSENIKGIVKSVGAGKWTINSRRGFGVMATLKSRVAVLEDRITKLEQNGHGDIAERIKHLEIRQGIYRSSPVSPPVPPKQ